jgi:putative FmdB family regulatory protein
MPIYEYKCDKCGMVFERWSSTTRDMDYTELCPNDGGLGKRIMSACTFTLAGDCWAKDGYTHNNRKAVDSGKSVDPN